MQQVGYTTYDFYFEVEKGLRIFKPIKPWLELELLSYTPLIGAMYHVVSCSLKHDHQTF